MKKRRWLWIGLFLVLVALMSVLATRWNIAWFKVADDAKARIEPFLGTLGFGFATLVVFLFLARLLHEMRINQLQSEFLAAISHELKTPIATLELSSSLLKNNDGLSIEDTEKLWRSHNTELTRLREEVETLLEAARWDAKAVNAQKSKENLELWLRSRWAYWTEILGFQIEIKREGEPLSFHVNTDIKLLNLITDNLIENASKFSKPQSKIIIRTSSENKKWKIEFIDSGYGFNPDENKKIFKRFYRAKVIAPHAVSGSGLGLHLAHEAAKKLKLKLSAHSLGHGHGATFTLEGGQPRA